MREKNDFEVMIETLKKSAIELADLPKDQRDAALGKTIDEFATAFLGKAEEAAIALADEAHADGTADGVFGLAKGENPVEDSMTVLGAMIAQAGAVSSAVAETLGKSETVDALIEWAAAGEVIAKSIGHHVDLQLAKGEVSEEEIKKAEAELISELKKAEDSFRKRVDALTKAGEFPPEGDEDEGAEDEVSGIEVIGRLAAAILVQVDKMTGGDQEEAAEGTGEGEGEMERSEKAADLTKSDEGNKVADADNSETAAKSDELAKADEGTGSEKADDLKKAEADNEGLRKQLASLQAEVEALKKNNIPAPKGVLRAVDKAADAGALGKADGLDLNAEAERLSKLSPEDRARELIKWTHRSGGRQFVG